MTDDEIALRAAINVLHDSAESGRMPSGIALTPDAVALHAHAALYLESLLRKTQDRQVSSQTCQV